MIKNIFLILSFCFIASCTPKGLYSWHNYENITYQYSKTQDKKILKKLIKEYTKIIKQQKGIRKTVPPGMYAEYGYLLYKTGKTKEGISFLEKEIELYPESKIYISRIIKQLTQ